MSLRLLHRALLLLLLMSMLLWFLSLLASVAPPRQPPQRTSSVCPTHPARSRTDPDPAPPHARFPGDRQHPLRGLEEWFEARRALAGVLGFAGLSRLMIGCEGRRRIKGEWFGGWKGLLYIFELFFVRILVVSLDIYQGGRIRSGRELENARLYLEEWILLRCHCYSFWSTWLLNLLLGEVDVDASVGGDDRSAWSCQDHLMSDWTRLSKRTIS